jgi:predicted nucleotidyltransferase
MPNRQLSEAQDYAVRLWAKGNRHVTEVRLFGSRAWGNATPESDIDLAVTIGEPGLDEGTLRGLWFALSKHWQEELTLLLQNQKVHVSLYNDPDGDTVRKACDAYCVKLFPVSDETATAVRP